MQIEIDQKRLARVKILKSGAHDGFKAGVCAMEAVAYIAREPWSDHPVCASPVISTFVRSWNDALPDEKRTTLLLPLVPKLVGTVGSPALEERRSYMAVDWLIRVHTPAWLILAGLTAQADLLANFPEIIGFSQIPGLRAPLEAIRIDAVAAGAAAGVAAGAAAWAVAWDAAGAVAWAAGDAAADAARAVAWAAAGDAAADAARAVAWAAAGDALKPTQNALQISAVALVERMIAARDDDQAKAA